MEICTYKFKLLNHTVNVFKRDKGQGQSVYIYTIIVTLIMLIITEKRKRKKSRQTAKVVGNLLHYPFVY